jgi:hypothetical protein
MTSDFKRLSERLKKCTCPTEHEQKNEATPHHETVGFGSVTVGSPTARGRGPDGRHLKPKVFKHVH